MKLLHTSDWHLGQKFISRERDEEHRLALDWLIQTIAEASVDLLIVAGDVFDIGNPPNLARSLYYGFLKKLRQTNCRHVVITGGNHDSPQMLQAPKDLLQLLDIHVVGQISQNPADDLLRLKNAAGEIEAVVAAVPFLRDQDLRRTVTADASQERTDKIKEGILRHYQTIGAVAEAFSGQGIPIIATGHLCATGAESSGKQDNIYLGNLENIRADQFPSIFDYVALGHIHRPQPVDGLAHVRYSGSLIPLSFSETKDEKSVTLVQFSGNIIQEIKELPVPQFRRLKSLEGNLAAVQERLEKLHHHHEGGLPSWVEVTVESDSLLPNLNGILQDFVKNWNLELLKTKLKYRHHALDEQVEEVALGDLLPIEVFRKKCESAGRAPEDMEELVATFQELQEWLAQKG